MIEGIQKFCKTNLLQYSAPHIIPRDDLKKTLNIIYTLLDKIPIEHR